MRELSPSVRRELIHARAILWANALKRTWNRTSNQGASLTDLKPEAKSLRLRVEARVTLQPAEEAKAIAHLMPLPAMREDPFLVERLAELVRAGVFTLAELQALMIREYGGQTRPRAKRAAQPAPTAQPDQADQPALTS